MTLREGSAGECRETRRSAIQRAVPSTRYRGEMADTLGSLCDKLTVVRLKLWHTKDRAKLDDLERQRRGGSAAARSRGERR